MTNFFFPLLSRVKCVFEMKKKGKIYSRRLLEKKKPLFLHFQFSMTRHAPELFYEYQTMESALGLIFKRISIPFFSNIFSWMF